ncbi:hypothetical protein BC831DRAFT_547850, partial [Entophlyctis helioformis]
MSNVEDVAATHNEEGVEQQQQLSGQGAEEGYGSEEGEVGEDWQPDALLESAASAGLQHGDDAGDDSPEQYGQQGADDDEDNGDPWDDSLLIEAWDAAVQKFRSMEAGDKPESWVKAQATTHQSKKGKRNGSASSRDAKQASKRAKVAAGSMTEASGSMPHIEPSIRPTSRPSETPSAPEAFMPNADSMPPMPSLPFPLPVPPMRPSSCAGCGTTNTAQGGSSDGGDRDLTSMLMAWYYAGYYTGLYANKSEEK